MILFPLDYVQILSQAYLKMTAAVYHEELLMLARSNQHIITTQCKFQPFQAKERPG